MNNYCIKRNYQKDQYNKKIDGKNLRKQRPIKDIQKTFISLCEGIKLLKLKKNPKLI